MHHKQPVSNLKLVNADVAELVLFTSFHGDFLHSIIDTGHQEYKRYKQRYSIRQLRPLAGPSKPPLVMRLTVSVAMFDVCSQEGRVCKYTAGKWVRATDLWQGSVELQLTRQSMGSLGRRVGWKVPVKKTSFERTALEPKQ
jgi:hypothetical protein